MYGELYDEISEGILRKTEENCLEGQRRAHLRVALLVPELGAFAVRPLARRQLARRLAARNVSGLPKRSCQT